MKMTDLIATSEFISTKHRLLWNPLFQHHGRWTLSKRNPVFLIRMRLVSLRIQMTRMKTIPPKRTVTKGTVTKRMP